MSLTRPNLFVIFLRALAVPMAGFAIWSAVERVAGSHRWILPAAIAGLFLLLILAAVAFHTVRLLIRHFRRHPEFEFGVEPPTCSSCGYDLRASPDHCPECGHPVDPVDRTIIQYLTRLRRKS